MSPRNSGFIQLGGGGHSHEMSEGIQLTTVKSNVSMKSTNTGHRKAGPGTNSFDVTSEENEDEKGAHRGRRRKLGDRNLTRTDTGDDSSSLNAMGRLYNKIVGFSVITRYLVYVVPVGLMLAVPLIVLPVTGHKDTPRVGKSVDGTEAPSLFKLFLWIEIMWLSLWIAKVVAFFLPSVFIFFTGVVSPGTRKYAQVIRNLILPLSFFFWALASYVTYINLYRAQRDNISWCQTMSRVLGALFVSSAVFLAEKAIVQLIGISYHQRSFANRIKASKREIHLLGLLYDASRTLFPMYCPEFADEDHVINDSIQMMIRGKKGHKRLGSTAPMKIIGDVGRIGDKLTSVVGNVASEITGKEVFNPNSAHSIVLEALEKTKSSEALARRIWMSFVVEGHDSLFVDDFQEVLGPAYKKEAEEAFYAIDNDENGDISLEEMILKVVEMGQERKAIAEGMKDIGQALQVFDQILLFFVMLLVILIFLLFFQSSFVKTLTTAGTTLLSLSFVFATTCQEFLGSCIFLFVKHPFDVGDRVEISATVMVVDKISLLYTVFHRGNNQTVQIPNIVLNNLWIENISRSKAMSETVTLDVSFDTSFEDVELLRAEMEKFVRSPENSRDFKPEFTVDVGGVNNLDKMTLKFDIQHKSNWHNAAVRGQRRSKFMCALALAMKRVPIYAPGGGGEPLGGPTNPSYSVAVSDEFAFKAREDSDQAKDGARLVPLASKGKQGEEKSEKNAIDDLSARPLVPDTAHRDDRANTNDTAPGLKRDATHGRRKAGETLPVLTLETAPRSSLSVRSAQPSLRSPQHGHFDEEAETGMGTTPYHSNLSATASGGSAGYQVYKTTSPGGGYSPSNAHSPMQGNPSQRMGPPKGPPPAGQY
ncbi:Mechanosensitive ion channel-domain-containing protein [Mariannaea sp. PMI_226]|nr:Mechanosensitive ion channel-domain-containing protein [Mariannaea sp. PMI_226]